MKIIIPKNNASFDSTVDHTTPTKILTALLIILTAFLICIGLSVVFSTTAPSTLQAEPDGFFLKQLTWVGIGSFFACIILFIGPKRLSDWRMILFLLLICWIMLLAARYYFTPINGAHRWINIGGAISFQPSELAKFTCIILIARWAYDHLRVIPNIITEIKDRFWNQLNRNGENKIKRILFFTIALLLFGTGMLLLLFCLLSTPEQINIFPGAETLFFIIGATLFLLGSLGIYAVMAGENRESPRRFYSIIWPLLLFGFTVAFVMLGKDLGMSVLICVSAFAIAFVAGISLRWIFAALGVLIMGVWWLLNDPTSFRYKRMCSFIDPENAGDAGYQIWMCLLALGSGGLTGRGLGQGRIKTGYLPEAHTDCILAITGEELGFISLIIILIVFLALIVVCAMICMRAANRRSMLLGSGMTIMLAVQMLINVAVVTSSIPAKGMPAPFISYGGSNMLISLMAIGVILSIAIESIYPAFHDKFFSFGQS